MFYDVKKNNHGMEIDPFKALVGPRPIGWISSLSANGTANLAPYSFFNAIADRPPMVMFSSAGRKDSLRNIEETGEFVCNLVSWDLREEMNVTGQMVGADEDEFVLAGLEKAPSKIVRPPRVKISPVALECNYINTIDLPAGKEGDNYALILGQVVGIYIADEFIMKDRVNTAQMKLVARLGYSEYSVVTETFCIRRA